MKVKLHAAARRHAAGVEGSPSRCRPQMVPVPDTAVSVPPVSATLRVTSAATDGPLLVKVTVPVTVQPRRPAGQHRQAPPDVRQRSTAVTPTATLLVSVPSAVVVVMVRSGSRPELGGTVVKVKLTLLPAAMLWC